MECRFVVLVGREVWWGRLVGWACYSSVWVFQMPSLAAFAFASAFGQVPSCVASPYLTIA